MERLLVHKINIMRHSCEKMYLNEKTADVHFKFGNDDVIFERVPAHKCLLSFASPVFDTMFYGTLPEKQDIPIVDSSAVAFKEFLQFFYLDQIRITSEYIIEVMNLCQKYEVAEGKNVCEATLKNALNINNMCWGYKIAQFLENKNLIEFCEQKIKTNASEIIKTETFLESGRKSLGKILEILPSDCRSLDIVNACIAWAKAECARENINRDPVNLRAKLGDVFNQMPFDKLTMENFSQIIISYNGFFIAKEMETIMEKITSNKGQQPMTGHPSTNKYESTATSGLIQLDCDRQLSADSFRSVKPNVKFCTSFSTNKNIYLTEFYAKLNRSTECDDIPAKIRIECKTRQKELRVGFGFKYDISEIFNQKTKIDKGMDVFHFVLPEPILIQATKFYDISTDMRLCCDNCPIHLKLKNKAYLEHGVKIKFNASIGDCNDFITRLIFLKKPTSYDSDSTTSDDPDSEVLFPVRWF